jgi:hypothetical protein
MRGRHCNGQWEGSVCGSWGKGSHLGSWGTWPARRGKRLAVGSRQRRRRDIAIWAQMRETDSPQLQEMVMLRVSAIVHCTAVIPHNHNRNHASLYYLFQENKSFGTHYHLLSCSDVREVESRTDMIRERKNRNKEEGEILKTGPPFIAYEQLSSLQERGLGS